MLTKGRLLLFFKGVGFSFILSWKKIIKIKDISLRLILNMDTGVKMSSYVLGTIQYPPFFFLCLSTHLYLQKTFLWHFCQVLQRLKNPRSPLSATFLFELRSLSWLWCEPFLFSLPFGCLSNHWFSMLIHINLQSRPFRFFFLFRSWYTTHSDVLITTAILPEEWITIHNFEIWRE